MSGRRGLTFIELLVAATIFAILAAGLTLHLRGGIDVWRRTTATMEADQRLRVTGDRLRLELANSVQISTANMADPSPDAASSFGAHAIAFTAALPRGAGRRLRLLRYEWRSETQQLLRTDCAFQDAAAGRCGQAQVMLEGVSDFSLRYGYRPAAAGADIIWDEKWPDTKQLPRLVEARLALASGPGQVRVDTIALPTGKWQTIEEAAQAAAAAPGPVPTPHAT